jgi:hypothetical protein
MALTRKKTKRVVKRYWPLEVAAVTLLLGGFAWLLAPASEWIEALSSKVTQLGALGPIIYFVLYVVGTVVLAPSPRMRRGRRCLRMVGPPFCDNFRDGGRHLFVFVKPVFLRRYS